MTLAEDVARWAWHENRFEETFGQRTEERFVAHWLAGRPYPASVLDRLLACAASHDEAWIAATNEVAPLV